MRKLFYAMCTLLVGGAILSVGCENASDETPTGLSVKVEVEQTDLSSISFTISSTDATEVRWLVTEASEGMCDAEKVLESGQLSQVNADYVVKANNLESDTTYLIAVAARNGKSVAIDYEIVSTKSKYHNEVALDFSFVRRLLDEEYADSDFALFFTDVEPEYELTLVFTAEAGEMLPEGEYSTEGGVNANIDAKRSFLSFTNGDEPIYFDKIEAWVRTSDPGYEDYYHIDVELYAGDVHYTLLVRDFVGNMPFCDISNMVIGSPVIRESEDGKRATIIFHTEDEKVTFVAETYLRNPEKEYLMPGQYTVKGGDGGFVAGDIDANNSWFIANGYFGMLASGTMNISINNDCDYVFVVDIVDELGREIKFEYSGYIPMMNFDRRFALHGITLTEPESGRYLFEFSGPYSLSFDVYADNLADGVYYILDADEAQGAYIDKSSLSFSSATEGDIAIKGGKMSIVELDDDYVELSFELLAEEDYLIWRGVYIGEIGNLKYE